MSVRPRPFATALAMAELCRPVNVALAAFAIWLGARFAGGAAPAELIHALGSALLLLGGGYAWNDVEDERRDRVVHPSRPIPSGRVSPAAARGLVVGLFVAASLSTIGLPPGARGLLLGWAVLLLAYRRLANRVPLTKNVVASLLTASALWLGALLGPHAAAALFPALFAFLLSWVRETVKDLADREGDRAVGRPSWIDSIPRPSARAAMRAAVLLLLSLIPVPVIFLDYGLPFLVAALIGVGGILLGAYTRLGALLAAEEAGGVGGGSGRAELVALSRRLKIGMAAGLAALLLGTIA